MRLVRFVSFSLVAPVLVLVGCATEPSGVETPEASAPTSPESGVHDENIDTQQQAILQMRCTGSVYNFSAWGGNTCGGTSTSTLTSSKLKSAKALAASYLRYLLGGTTVPDTNIPSTGETYSHSGEVSRKLCQIRAALAAGQVSVVSRGTLPLSETCNIPTTEFRFSGYIDNTTPSIVAACGSVPAGTPGVGTLITDIERSLRAKNGWNQNCANYPTFFRLDNATAAEASIDPEPAVLNASLGSTTGASASAYWKATGVGTTAYRAPTSFTYCSSSIPGGAPCHSTSANYGTEINGVIQRMGGNCRCVL